MKISKSTSGFLALWLIPGLGPRRIKKLWEHFGDFEHIINSSPENLAKIIGVKTEICKTISHAYDSEIFKQELDLIEKHEINVIDILDDNYPKLLRETYDAPPILYQKGSIDFNKGTAIAFVGSRKASFAGKSICQKLIKRLAEINPEIVIVSGLALGIDSIAHTSALEAGLKTISVLAGGLSGIYPTQNRKLSETISKNGSLITEFPVGTRPVAMNFPLRNRIISGISKGIVIVEAGERSGATITAGYALEQNRELFALPGPADSSFYKGTNRLIQKGQAKLVLQAEDILEEIIIEGIEKKQVAKKTQAKEPDIELSSNEKAVLNILANGNVQQEALANGLKMPVHKLLSTLTTLELKGLIISKPGSVYEAVNL